MISTISLEGLIYLIKSLQKNTLFNPCIMFRAQLDHFYIIEKRTKFLSSNPSIFNGSHLNFLVKVKIFNNNFVLVYYDNHSTFRLIVIS